MDRVVVDDKNTGKEGLVRCFGWALNFLGFALVIAMFVLGIYMLDKSDLRHDRPIGHISKIKLAGNFTYVDPVDIETNLQHLLDKEFVNLDLMKVERLLTGHPWIRSTVLRKKWPDTLTVKVIEQVPVAVLTSGGYLNSRAEIFDRKRKIEVFGLPLIDAEVKNYQAILKVYAAFKQSLPTDLGIARLSYQHIGNYIMHLTDGSKVVLGRRQLAKRIKNLSRVFKFLQSNELPRPEVIDMRYRNAVAVKFIAKAMSNE